MILMEDNAGRYIVHNGILKDCSEIEAFDMKKMTGKAAYEVIRIINGVPLFFEDHYDRLKATFKTIGKPLDLTNQQLAENIKRLKDKIGNVNCNVKIVVLDGVQHQEYVIYVSRSYYPADAEVDAGVRTGMVQIERKNPNAKIIDKVYKDAVEKRRTEGDYFEVILVDYKGRITEGSKSNLFFVKNGRIITTPEKYVLKGITRKYILEACGRAGFDVEQEFVRADEIGTVEGCFLSGTSIKVLPIKSIDDVILNSSANPVISAVRQEYDRIISEYIDRHVKLW